MTRVSPLRRQRLTLAVEGTEEEDAVRVAAGLKGDAASRHLGGQERRSVPPDEGAPFAAGHAHDLRPGRQAELDAAGDALQGLRVGLGKEAYDLLRLQSLEGDRVE